ncbi:MAG: fimbrial protein [Enterobacterales bacterium]
MSFKDKMNKYLLTIKKLLLIIFFLTVSGQQAVAGIKGVHGLDYNCLPTKGSNGNLTAKTHSLIAGQCTLSSPAYLPHAGSYKVRTKAATSKNGIDFTFATSATTTSAVLDETKSIANQDVTVSGSTVSYSVPGKSDYYGCQYLVDEAGKEYVVPNGQWPCDEGSETPLPPNPPVVNTSCTVNSGNALGVEFGTIDRAKLPTVAGSGEMKSVPVNVNCTGGNVTVNMQLDYNPISVGESKVAISSTNGLGVAIAYNNKVLSTTDITPVTFQVGNNTLNLAFQAVRDPSVAEGDVPVGYFTSTATLVMTQQ